MSEGYKKIKYKNPKNKSSIYVWKKKKENSDFCVTIEKKG